MTGLERLLPLARGGASVLDLGCAEGLIAMELRLAGAGFVHGVELVTSRATAAAKLFAYQNAQIVCADLNQINRLKLRPSYDIVLALSVAHKLSWPDAFLRRVAQVTAGTLAVRLPTATLRDVRSGYRPIDVPALLRGLGLSCWYEAPGPRGEWLGVFRR